MLDIRTVKNPKCKGLNVHVCTNIQLDVTSKLLNMKCIFLLNSESYFFHTYNASNTKKLKESKKYAVINVAVSVT